MPEALPRDEALGWPRPLLGGFGRFRYHLRRSEATAASGRTSWRKVRPALPPSHAALNASVQRGQEVSASPHESTIQGTDQGARAVASFDLIGALNDRA